MKKITFTLFVILVSLSINVLAQNDLEIDGQLKIGIVPPDNSADSVLVRRADNVIAQQLKEALLDRDASACALGYYVIPADFDFQNIPASYANSIWEIRHCHNLQNNTVTLPKDVILSFKGGKLTNFQNLMGDKTSIEAYSTQIFDGMLISGTWTVEHVNVCWFGAKTDPTFDSQPAFDNATIFANSVEGAKRILIPSGKYHLEEVWKIGSAAGWNPVNVDGYGAILDNTVVVATTGIGLRGLTIDGAQRHGVVFLRGQGAHHEHLLAQNCGLDGFYCGADLGGGDYGANFQVTRSVFTSLVALNNGRHGWYMEGASTANRSWFNANSVIGFAAVSNAQKGFVWQGGTGPNGASQMNYNTFLNMNCEGNDDISVDLPEGRANTFIGGHFVDKDSSDYCMRLDGPFNFNFGGRYIGQVENPAFIYSNTDQSGEGGIIGNIKGADIIKTKELEADNEPYMPKGWSILPRVLESGIVASDNINNHQFSMDLSGMPSSDGLMLRVTRFGQRNFSGGYDQKYSYALLIHLTTDTNGTSHLSWNRFSDDQNCVINSVAILNGVVTVDFSTTYLTFGTGYGVTEYQDSDDTDFR